MTRLFSKQRGLTLIEVAVFIAIAGLMVATGLTLYQRAEEQRKLQTTHDRMDKIVRALSVFVQTSGRLPCPADPALQDLRFGWEKGVSLAQLQAGSGTFPVPAHSSNITDTCRAAESEGILPFLTLGLTNDDARDGWGRYFTYAVSPVFAQRSDFTQYGGIPNDVGYVHDRCRHNGWVKRFDQDANYNIIDDNDNINAVKARFCCAVSLNPSWAGVELWTPNGSPGQPTYAPPIPSQYTGATDLRIAHTSATTTYTIAQRANYNTANFGPVGTTEVTASGNAPVFNTNAIVTPAFVLVSHGRNGRGAYVGDGSAARHNMPPSTSLEYINADANITPLSDDRRRTFIDGPFNTRAGDQYFDDIVRWMTQDGIMAAQGSLSCAYP